jgi:hypothetical protein
MRYRLRTLLIVMALAALVAAVVRISPAWGLFAYATLLSLFVIICRIRTVCRRIDEAALLTSAPNSGAMILWANAGLALLATLTFYVGWTVTSALLLCVYVMTGRPLLVSGTYVPDFWDYLFAWLMFTMPVGLGTAATLALYWLTWPAKKTELSCPATSSARC